MGKRIARIDLHEAGKGGYTIPQEAAAHQCFRCPFGTYTGMGYTCGWVGDCLLGEKGGAARGERGGLPPPHRP